MKVHVLVTALALACGSAFAAGDTAPGKHDATTDRSAVTATEKPAGDTLADKAQRALHRMGDATRNAMHKIAGAGRKADDKADQAASKDTRSMGAAGSGAGDSARQKRMDDAESNWRNKQPQK